MVVRKFSHTHTLSISLACSHTHTIHRAKKYGHTDESMQILQKRQSMQCVHVYRAVNWPVFLWLPSKNKRAPATAAAPCSKVVQV